MGVDDYSGVDVHAGKELGFGGRGCIDGDGAVCPVDGFTDVIDGSGKALIGRAGQGEVYGLTLSDGKDVFLKDG